MRALPVVAILSAVACLSAAGCAKKKAPAVASDPVVPAPIEAPAEPTQPLAEPVASPLDGDLDAINRYLHEQGLVSDVYYAFDSSDLHDEARGALRRLAEFMTAHPEFVFTLEGHCDERGSISYNLALGDRRASAAQGYLSSLAVPRQLLQTTTLGEERPVCTESAEECWSRNRRTHIRVTGRQAP